MALPSGLSVQAKTTPFSSRQAGEKEADKTPQKKDLFDRIAQRTQEAEGAWDFFRVVCHTTQYPQLFSSLKEPHKTNIKTISTAADLCGAALAFPALFKNVNDFRHHYRDLTAAKALPDSHPEKPKKIREALGNALLDANNTLNSASQGSLFLNDSKLVGLGKGYPVASGVFNVTSIIGDGVEGVREVGKVQKHLSDMKKATSVEEKKHIHQNIKLSACILTKDVASVALAIIGLLALAFAAVFSGWVFLPVLILGLTAIYLITKIGGYFYEQILKDRPPLEQRLIKA